MLANDVLSNMMCTCVLWLCMFVGLLCRHNDLRDELLARITDLSHSTTAASVEIDKRLVLAEELVQSVLERLDMSQTVFDGLLASSPDVKSFQATSVKLDGLLLDFSSLRYA